jgi:hypothetical protein
MSRTKVVEEYKKVLVRDNQVRDAEMKNQAGQGM